MFHRNQREKSEFLLLSTLLSKQIFWELGWTTHLLRANRGSVHGLDKWFEKFGTGKFRPGIALTICSNQFHLPENGFEEMEHEFPFVIFRPRKKKGLPFQMFRCSRKFSVGKTQNVVFHYFPTGFPGKQPVCSQISSGYKDVFKPKWTSP